MSSSASVTHTPALRLLSVTALVVLTIHTQLSSCSYQVSSSFSAPGIQLISPLHRTTAHPIPNSFNPNPALPSKPVIPAQQPPCAGPHHAPFTTRSLAESTAQILALREAGAVNTHPAPCVSSHLLSSPQDLSAPRCWGPHALGLEPPGSPIPSLHATASPSAGESFTGSLSAALPQPRPSGH